LWFENVSVGEIFLSVFLSSFLYAVLKWRQLSYSLMGRRNTGIIVINWYPKIIALWSSEFYESLCVHEYVYCYIAYCWEILGSALCSSCSMRLSKPQLSFVTLYFFSYFSGLLFLYFPFNFLVFSMSCIIIKHWICLIIYSSYIALSSCSPQ
jgi:hypothetical protein